MADKTLAQSRKAKSAWIGAAVIAGTVFGGYKAGIPLEWVSMAVTAIGGLFGAQIISQGAQDAAGAIKGRTDADRKETDK